jgi:YfiH family protein
MILNHKNSLSYFQFPNLARFPELWHGVFTRHGGVSPSPFHSLNTAISVGDDVKNAYRNRELILQLIGHGELVSARQVHGKDVIVFSKALKNPALSLAGDAIISDMIGKYLLIQTADCQAVFLYDPIRRVAGNIHSGWRGSLLNIIAHTIHAMTEHFGCNPRDMSAGIGPSLGQCCAEFVNYEHEIPEAYWKYKDNNHYFDFWAISADQLRHSGVLPQNIHTSRICTRCRTDLFFSYRGEKKTGRFAAIIGLER